MPRPTRPAIFLDRDGTLIESVHHLRDPREVRLVPGGAEALESFRRAGYARVLVTNQSVVGRGVIDEARLDEIHRVLLRQLAEGGASLDALYYSTSVPGTNDRTVVEHPDRKPGPGLLLRAAGELNLALAESWMIGDMISDVLAASNAGCKGCFWITDERASAPSLPETFVLHRVPDLATAARRVPRRAR